MNEQEIRGIVSLLASHYFGSLPDGRDTFAFSQEELIMIRDGKLGISNAQEDDEQELLSPEEIRVIIRQHNEARVKPSHTELSLIKAQLAKLKRILRERGVDAKYLDVGH